MSGADDLACTCGEKMGDSGMFVGCACCGVGGKGVKSGGSGDNKDGDDVVVEVIVCVYLGGDAGVEVIVVVFCFLSGVVVQCFDILRWCSCCGIVRLRVHGLKYSDVVVDVVCGAFGAGFLKLNCFVVFVVRGGVRKGVIDVMTEHVFVICVVAFGRSVKIADACVVGGTVCI